MTPGWLPLLRGETTDAVSLLEVLSSHSYRLTSSYLLTRHQRAVPLTKIIVYTLSTLAHRYAILLFSLDVEIDDSLVGQLTTSTHAHSTISTHRGTFVCRLDRFGQCMRTTLFSPPAKFSRRCYSALADSHRQPHTCTSVQF